MKKKFLILFLYCFLSPVYSQSLIKINGLDASLKDQQGTGVADFFRIDSNSYLRSREKFDIEFEEDSAIFLFSKEELEVRNLPPFISKKKNIEIKKLDIDYNYLNTGIINFNQAIINEKTFLNSIKLNCFKMGQFNFEDIIASCAEEAVVSGDSVIINGKKQQNIISEISLTIKDHKFELKAKLKGLFVGRLVATGEVYYHKEEKLLKVEVITAHLGIVPVKGTLFAILKKQETKKFKVEKPYLLVYLD